VSEQPLSPEQVAAVLERLTVKTRQRLVGALRLAGEDHVAGVDRGMLQRGLHVRSGYLRRSLGYEVAGANSGPGLDGVALRTFSAGTSYARLQEYGGEVSPKNVKNLTLPQKAALTAAGVARFSARELLERRGDAFFLKDKRGRVWLVAPRHEAQGPHLPRPGPGKPGPLARLTNKNLRRPKTADDLRRRKKRDLDFYFLLIPHAIYVPPRLGFFRTWDQQAPRRAAIFTKALRAALEDASAGGGA